MSENKIPYIDEDNSNIEKTVLGIIVHAGSKAEQTKYLNLLAKEDFSGEKWRGLYLKFREITDRDHTIDTISLYEYAGEIIKPAEIIEFDCYQFKERELPQYIYRLITKRYALEARKLRPESFEYIENFKAIYDKMNRRLADLGFIYESDFDITSTGMNNFREDYYRSLGDGSRELIGIDTGFPGLNSIISGIRGLVIMAGRPKIGKTTFIYQLCCQAAEKGTPILFYSLEMSRFQLITKDLSRRSGIPYIELMLKGALYLQKTNKPAGTKWTENQIINLMAAEQDRLKVDNFYIRSLEDKEEPITFRNVEREIRAIQKKHHTKDVIIVIDHLQVFPLETNYTEILAKENALIMKFNEIQKKTGSTIILISQKNKPGVANKTEKDEGRQMASVKGSVDLVYLASLLLFLDPNEDDADNKKPGQKFLTLGIISRDTPGGAINYTYKTINSVFEEKEIVKNAKPTVEDFLG